MGYIERAAGLPNFSSAVFSCFLRVPSESITAAFDAFDAIDPGDLDGDGAGIFAPPLAGIIPLMTFGSGTLPSYIGIDTTAGGGDASLIVVLQTADTASGQTGYDPLRADAYQINGNLPITPDVWQHVVLSFDLTGGSATMDAEAAPDDRFNITSFSEFWLAINDVNKDGNTLAPAGGYGDDIGIEGFSVNGIVSQGVVNLSIGEDGSTSLGSTHLSTSGNLIGTPADSRFASNIYKIQMADMYLFTGMTLDTSVEGNRRVFITEDGKPASPSLSAALLGKSPEILFQTTSDWINGNNRGTAGDFDPTGTISPYTPGPSED